MLRALEPLTGKRVLDLGCGAGVTSALLAQRGAIVTGIDVSPDSIARARQLAEHLGVSVAFVVGEMTPEQFPENTFDAVAGRYVLHHLDLRLVAPALAEVLTSEGRAAFVETMATNPVLRLARKRLAGRAGIANYGSEDERPLTGSDLRLLADIVGEVDVKVGQMTFLRIFDRNVLRYRRPRASVALAAIDDVLLRLGRDSWSYHQVITITRTAL